VPQQLSDLDRSLIGSLYQQLHQDHRTTSRISSGSATTQ
jgi:hypothetical protein